jgi:hypothetical protein
VVTRSDAPEFVLVPDGHGGLRMARADAARASAWDTDPVSLDPASASRADFPPAAGPPAEAPDMGRAMAVALGVCLLGVVLGVSLLHHRVAAAPAVAPLAAAAPTPRRMTIVPDAPAPPAALAATLPPPLTNLGPANAIPAAAVRAPSVVAHVPTPVALAQPATPRPWRVPAPIAASTETRGSPASPDAAGPEENGCGGSPADRMVCGDQELGDFDREMRQDLRAAAGAGVPIENLRAGQADFARRRDAAARRSPEALAEIYDQRIVELERMIADAPH